MMKTVTTYEFSAFPTRWYDRKRREWRFSVLSTIGYTTLAEARREVARLRRIYAAEDKRKVSEYRAHKRAGKKDSWFCSKPTSMLTGYKSDPEYLKITRVDRTPLDLTSFPVSDRG